MKLTLFHLVAYVVVGVVSDSFCSISSISPAPDLLGNFPTYHGIFEQAGNCKGLPVFGDNFASDALTRTLQNEQQLASSYACCLGVGCGPDLNGSCTSKGNICNGDVAPYYAQSWCPGSASQCCPDPEYLKLRASTNDDTNFFAQEDLANPDVITGGEEIGLGNLNLDDWTATPLESENLFLASDDTNDFGLIAGLGDLTGWDVENTA